MLADICAGVESVKVQYMLLLLAVLFAVTVAGCTSSAPAVGNQTESSRNSYTNAYYTGLEHHYNAECNFNNGTGCWERESYRQAISDYANASMEYDAAAANYEVMGRYAADQREKDFGDSMRQCSVNLSRAATNFMESAIALQAENTDKAYSLFELGQAEVNASDVQLNRSAYLLPVWLRNASHSE